MELVGLLERERELLALDVALEQAAGGRGAVVVVEGEPGSGKSALLRAACTQAPELGLLAVSARGLELERSLPFGVARQLLARRVDLPQVIAPADAPVADRRLASIQALYETVVRLVWPQRDDPATVPLLLAVDDAHWSDEPSLSFLAHLASRTEELPVVLVVAVRTAQPQDTQTLLDAFYRARTAEVLRPMPLTEPAVALLTRSQLGADATDELCDACARASAGNPFYLHELLRALGPEPQMPSPDRVREIAPDAVLRSVMVRLGHLRPEAAALARAVAVLGDGASLDDGAELAAIEGPDAEAVADALARESILARGEPLRFCHPLVASTLTADMGAFEAARAHRRAAELMLRRRGGGARAAAHLLLARPEGDEQAVDVLEAAAEAARNDGDPASAAELLRRALAEPPPAARRPELTLKLAQTEALGGSPRAAETLETALSLIGQADDRAELMATLATVTHLGGDFRAAAELARRAREELEGDHPLSGRLLAIEVGAASLHPELQAEAEAHLAPLVASARAGRPPREPGLLAQVAARLAHSDPPAAVPPLAEQAIAHDPLIDDDPQGTSIGWLGSALVWVDELELAERWLESAVEEAERRGAVTAASVALVQRADVHFHRGRLDEAVADADRALALHGHDWVGSAWSIPVLARAHIERGDLDAAGDAIAAAEPSDDASLDQALLILARAELRLARRDPGPALADALAVGRQIDEQYGTSPPRVFEWRRIAALAADRLGRVDEARDLLEPALSTLKQIGPPRQLGAALVAAGILAGGDEGVELLSEAAYELEASPSRLGRAHALLEHGAALRRAGRRTRAKEPLYRALELADPMGATPLVERAREELAVLGVRPRRAARTGLAALTPSERRVADLAARGLSTPQIAHELHVTPKTVETHLGRVYRKLHIGGRGELRSVLEPAVAGAGDASSH